MRLRSAICVCLFASCTAATSLTTAGCSSAKATPTERGLPPPLPDGVVRIPDESRPFIDVQPAGSDPNAATVRAPARVEFRDGAVSQLGAPMEGRIVQVHVATGDLVKAGDALLTLDCPEAANVRAAVDTVTASLREAHAALERERRMIVEGVGIERDRLAAETKVSELEAERVRALAAVAFVGVGSGTRVLLRAPISGTVIARKASEGMAVQQGGDPLMEIADPSTLWVVADVFERDLSLVHQGATAQIELPSVQGTLDGRVTSIGTVVSSGLRTAPVRIAVSSRDARLRPGMFGRADIALAPTRGRLTLPIEAVLVKGKDTVVYVQRDATTFERRAVTVAQPVNGRVEIVSGLTTADRVVVRGALLLDGSADQLL
jgi:membrane fusion protein, heavy metal efflux system